jgi:iron complex outermembrane receptor protein
MFSFSRKKALCTGISIALGSVGAAGSQITMAAETVGSLEEITVTARKREENMQQVAISVSALSQTEVERSFARDIKDLAFVSPNLIIDDTSQGPGGNAALFIRGIGVADVEKNFEPAVGVTIDGLFIGANSGAILRSIDLASVEVLRGPQGTLFGRNTVGGMINVETSKPTGKLGGKVRVGYGNYDTTWTDGILNFGVSDKLAVKLSFADHDQHKGYFYNIPTGKDQGRNNYKSYGIHLLSNVTDTVELQYILRNEKTVEDVPPLVNMAQSDTLFCGTFGLCAQSLTTPSSGDRYKTNTLIFQPTTWALSPPPDGVVTSAVDTLTRNLDPATFNATTNIFKAQWKVSDAVRMDYIFGSYKTNETIVSNWTAESVMMFGTDRPAEYSQKSHELRMSYNSGGPLNFVVGAYKWDSEYDIRLRSWITFVVPDVVLDIPQNTHQETSSKAAFFDGDYAFDNRWTLNIGGRYTKDEKLSRQRGNLSTAPDDPTAAWSEFTPKASLRYKLLDDTMLFASFSKGYRSGGFNGRVDSQDSARNPYNPEYVNNYEAGIKSEWLNHRLRLNGSVFYMSYKDKQEEIGLRSTGATGQRITVFNAASATLKGAELELQAQATQHLNLRANVGLLDTKYDKFTYDSGFGIVDNSGLKFRRAPKFTGSLDFTYSQAIGAGEAWVRGSYHHIGEHFIEQSNRPELHNNAENLVDLSVNYSIKDMSFSVFGRNLTGEDAWAHALNVSGLWAYASPIAPRTFGAEATFKFGGN